MDDIVNCEITKPRSYVFGCFSGRFFSYFFFFNDTATTEIYTLSLHDALPISGKPARSGCTDKSMIRKRAKRFLDRKSTRLNSSHSQISYAVFCLKKKKIMNASCRALDHSTARYLAV